MNPLYDDDESKYLVALVALIVMVLGAGAWVATQRAYPDSGYSLRLARSLGFGPSVRVRDGYLPSEVGGPRLEVAAPEPAPVEALLPAAQPAPPEAASPAPAGPDPGARARVVGTDGLGVVLRTQPRDDARVPRGLLEGARVTVLEPAIGPWVWVRADTGQEGWVPLRFVAVEPR